jgi:tyrosine-protein phosphatase SIW14
MFKSTGHICKITLLLALACVSGSCTSTQARSKPARPAQWAVPIERQGLGNFYKVTDDLYRGEQPTAEGIAQLRQIGIKTIVDLRDSHSDAAEIGNTPINCEYIPMLAWSPKHEDVVKFLRIATDKKKTPVFVHCKRGADRTGYMCAAYRVAVCGWSKEDAVDEMVHGGYHFSPLWQGLIDSIMKLDVQQIRQQAGLQN